MTLKWKYKRINEAFAYHDKSDGKITKSKFIFPCTDIPFKITAKAIFFAILTSIVGSFMCPQMTWLGTFVGTLGAAE